MLKDSHFLFELETDEIDERPIYLVGNFNNWNPRDEKYKMSLNENGNYEFNFPWEQLPQHTEYKYTKGGWENVEIDKYGNIHGNRKITKNGAASVVDFVPRWRDNWAPYKEEYYPIVELISDCFEIPQLDKTRRIWALLPYDYYETDKHYPVLYLQDAQNLFNEGSEYGNWEIDKKLSILAEYGRGDVIIIAIEHGNEDRLREYVINSEPLMVQGDGKKYIRFVTDTLKPHIDRTYRTLKDRENTGIGGSSLGGLISIYGGLLYPEVYSKLMVFSPSLWAVPKIDFPIVRLFNPFRTKIYIYGGAKEGANMVEHIYDFANKMEQFDDDKERDFEFKISINPEGTHTEFYWSQEFPKAIEWLYYDSLEDPLNKYKSDENE